jgi:hypothetical protein
MKLSRIGAAGAAISVLALAGCGGGKDSAHKAFASQLDAICKQDNAKLAKLTIPQKASDIPAYVSAAIPIVQDESTRLGQLKAPADQQANVQQAQGILAKQVSVARQMSGLAASGDNAGIQRLINQNSGLHTQAQKLAKKMGSKECAK